MEKIIKIGEKNLRLKNNGIAMLMYKCEFGRDLLKDLLSLCGDMKAAEENQAQAIDISKLDTEIFFNIIYIFAKIADSEIGTMSEWLSSFESFPLVDVIQEVLPFITESITMDASLKKRIATASLKQKTMFSKQKKSFWRRHKRA